jgi:hypothetical protein
MSKGVSFFSQPFGLFVLGLLFMGLPTLLFLLWLLNVPPDEYFPALNEQDIPINCKLIPETINADDLEQGLWLNKVLVQTKGCNVFLTEWQIKELSNTLVNNYPDKKDLIQLGLITMLTEQTLQKVKGNLEVYNPDYMKGIMDWLGLLNGAAKLDPENEVIYLSITDYWLNLLSGKLTDYQKINPDIRYYFKFRYLVQHCNEALYFVNVEETKYEKFKKNLLANHWIHLIQASWSDAKLWQKVALSASFLLTVFTYLFTLSAMVNKIKMK